MTGGEGSNQPAKEAHSITFQFPQLTSTNYTIWRMRMEVLLGIYGVWDVIDPGSMDVKRNNIVKGLLFQAIPEDVILQIGNLATGKAMWDAIKTRNLGADRVKEARLQTLTSKFENLKMKDTGSIDEFAAKLSSLKFTSATLAKLSSLKFTSAKLCLYVSCNLCIPIIENPFSLQVELLTISCDFLKCVIEEKIPNWLPLANSSLKHLCLLFIQLGDLSQLHGVLCLLRNSPNLEKLRMILTASKYPPVDAGPDSNHFEAPNFLEYTLNQLQNVFIAYPEGSRLELLFIKLLLAHSPSLKEFPIVIVLGTSQKELDIGKDVMEFPRASPKSQVIFI